MRRPGVCAMFVAGAVHAVAAAGPATAAAPRFEPHPHRDAGEHRNDPLDLREAAFGQVGTQLSLTVRTRRAWSATGPSDDSLCVTLLGDEPVGRICLAANRAGKPIVRFRGRTVRGAAVEQSGRTLRVSVYPRALGLRPGRLRWFVRGHADRLPDAGDLPLQVSVYGAPRCFGAAASECVNPALERIVFPDPSDAELMPDLRCRRARDYKRYEPVVPCYFGAQYLDGPPHLALIGDSHAMSFRSTADVAAHALRLKAISLTEAGCGFATEVDQGWPPVGKRCRRYTEQVLRWLGAHPSVHTVVLTSMSTRGYSEDGLRAIWSRIPSSVSRIFVVVDVPRVTHRTAGCVRAVRKRHAVSAKACPVPRDVALPHDPVIGAAAEAEARVHLIDLTRFFCDAEQCYPVIGGAYVYRDTHHMNLVFAPTLGPYLLQEMG